MHRNATRKNATSPPGPANSPLILAVLWTCGLAVSASAEAGQRVVVRLEDGRFLQAAEDGSLRAGPTFPTKEEVFELVPCPDGHVVLKAPGGCFLMAAGRDARSLRADSPRLLPGDRETFEIIPVGETACALRPRHYRECIVFPGAGRSVGRPRDAAGPGPQETVEIYYFGEVPAAIRTALAVVIPALVTEELGDAEYEKLRTRKTEKYVNLPAPTLRNPRRMKRHRVLSTTEEYHLTARLGGRPEIEIPHMPYLTSYRQPEAGLLMFVVRASVPTTGRVRYRLPHVVSASTGFCTVVALGMVGEVGVRKSRDEVSLSAAELADFWVELRSLDISNDVLQVARREIEDLINRELRKKRAHICRQANRELRKAVESQQFRHPLMQHLATP